MKSIVEHIQYLITKHDCVIVPGLGGFIAQYNDSTISSDREIIYSPSRNISFNAMLVHNDGLLVTSIMRAERCSYDQAVDYVSSEVKTIKNQMILDEEFAIANIGSLKLSDNKIIFSPSISVVSKNNYYGLKSINISPLDSKIVKNDCIVEELIQPQKNYLSINKNWIKLAASVAILILISFTLTTPIVWNNTNKASIIPEIKPMVETNEIIVSDDTMKHAITSNDIESVTELKEEVIDNVEHKVNVEPKHTQEVKEIKSVEKDINALNTPHSYNISDYKTTYYVIVSSHASLNEANKYIQKGLKYGDDLKVIESNGKFRIYISNSDSYNEVKSALTSVSKNSRYKNAWIWQDKN